MTSRLMFAVRSAPLRAVTGLGVQASLAALFAVVTARWMGPNDRGVIVVTTTTVSLLMLVGSFGAATGGRLLLSQEASTFSLRHHKRLALLLPLGHILTISIIGLPLLVLTGGWYGSRVAVAFCCYGVVMLAVYILREGVHGVARHGTAIAGDVILNAVLVAGAVILHLYSKLTVLNITLLLFSAALVELMYLTIMVTKLQRPVTEDNMRSLSSIIRMSLPALAAGVAQAIVIRGDRLLLGTYDDATAVGLYGTAATFAETLWLIPLGVGQILFHYSAQGEVARMRRLQRITVGCVVVLALVIGFIARPTVSLLLGDAYSSCVPLIWLLLAASVPMSIYHLQAPVLNGAGDFRSVAAAAVAAAIVLAVTCILLIPRWGAYGAGASSLIAYCVMAVISCVGVGKLRR